ncbi:hypothetical protein EYB25_004474 [Talaromyces marneffei]|nr:hypothetical protein EYB25_004474 [Talaromyces marneffei]
MARLVMVGVCFVDTILSVDHYPEEDEKLRASSLTRRRGGNCPNSLEVIQQLINLSQLKLSLNLISVLPALESASTRFIKQTLGPDVNCNSCIYRPDSTEPASAYVINSQRTGSRTIVSYNELPQMTLDEFSSSVEKLEHTEKTYFHFEGTMPEENLQCILHIRHKYPSAFISVEVENPRRVGLEKLAAEADLVFYAKGWAQAQGYSSMEECLEAQIDVTPEAKYLCCTWGKEGASLLIKPDNTRITVPALEVPDTNVVDSIGAGDTFVAGMLFGILCHTEDWDHERKLRFATELAGLKVRQDGFQGLGVAMNHRLR